MGWWLMLPAPVRSWIEKISLLALWTVLCLGLGAAASWNYLHHKYMAEQLEADKARADAVAKLVQENAKSEAELRGQLDVLRQERDANQALLTEKFNKLSKDLHNELSKPAAKCAPTPGVISLWNDSLRSGGAAQ